MQTKILSKTCKNHLKRVYVGFMEEKHQTSKPNN